MGVNLPKSKIQLATEMVNPLRHRRHDGYFKKQYDDLEPMIANTVQHIDELCGSQ